MATLFPWMGSKGRLVQKLLPLFPEHRCFVEVFGGAAALLFAKEPSKATVYNDIDGELVNVFRIVQRHPDALAHEFSVCLASRSEFARRKSIPPEALTDIERAARFLYLQKLCYSGKPAGRTFGVTTTGKALLMREPLQERIDSTHERLQGVVIEELDWRSCIERYDRPYTLFYLDPPYFETTPYREPFPEEEYVAMAEVMGKLKGRAVLSVGDHPRMREIFSAFERLEVSTRYSLGSSRKRAVELVYRTRGSSESVDNHVRQA